MGIPKAVYRAVRSGLQRLAAPLRADEEMTQFTLSVPEAQTTTVDSVQGIDARPPAVLRCPQCQSQILQARALDRIDCPECVRTFREDAFPDLELLAMICPRCETEMQYGRRHPRVFDRPEWATCPDCQYHWDLDHWF